ncbi:MAG: galactokinase [Oscillospiraceae bacterium]|nr:galactokinase [Oscillospiraceae bacterium]
MNAQTLKKRLAAGGADSQLAALYGGKTGKAVARCKELINRFVDAYGDREELHIFSAPGRTEIGGNHTDHNGGLVLAAAVNLDTLAVAAQSPLPIVRVQSAGHPENLVMLGDLNAQEHERNSANALVRGVCAYFSQCDKPVGGFDAVTASDVLLGSGLSSSAAFSVLIGVILDNLYGSGQCDPIELAMAGKFAENRYFGKPSGMMDQTVSAHGGLVLIDFGARGAAPVIRRLDCDLSAFKHTLCIAGPIGSHADLIGEYAAVTHEMEMVSAHFGRKRLREVDEKAFESALPALYGKVPDRAILRAMHFFAENSRVLTQTEALTAGDFPRFLSMVRRSGRSSFMYLQNVIHGQEEGLALALALSERLLDGDGATRVHGGGFAGTIQAFVPTEKLDAYITGMERVLGTGICQPVKIRPVGATMII